MKRVLRKIPTPQSLAAAALDYLGRYAASEASLRGVLMKRLYRAGMDNPDFAADRERMTALRSAIETIIEGHKKTGGLDDAVFAETRINSLRRQGRSTRAIQQRLGLKGIKGDVLAAALVQNADGVEPEEVELKAAMALARRRKLGPFRKTSAGDTQKRKDFATLARAGFSSDIARKVMNAGAPEERE